MLLICAFSYIQYTKQRMHSVQYNTLQIIKYSSWYQLIYVSATEYHHQEVYQNKGTQELHAAYSCMGPIGSLICILIVVNSFRLLSVCQIYATHAVHFWSTHLCSFVLIDSLKMALRCRKMMELRHTMKHTMTCISLYFTGCIFGDILNTSPGS